MKDDAVVRVSRGTYARAKRFARDTEREMREIMTAALEAYLASEPIAEDPLPVRDKPPVRPSGLFPVLGVRGT
jgi:hypothetical protein